MRQKRTPRRLSNQEKRNKAEWSSLMVLRLTMASFTRSADSTMIASDASVVKHIPITRKQAEKITKHKSVSCFHQAQASAKPRQWHITHWHQQEHWGYIKTSVMHYTVGVGMGVGLSSTMIRSLNNTVHPPDMENNTIHPPDMENNTIHPPDMENNNPPSRYGE